MAIKPGSIRLLALLQVLLVMVAGCSGDTARPAWNDIDVIRENVEAPRAHFIPYRSAAAALAGDQPAIHGASH